MDASDETTRLAAQRDRAGHVIRTMSHHQMVRQWRSGLAEPVSPEIISYVRYDGAWWRRAGAVWQAIPDGPLAGALAAGHDRLAARVDGDSCDDADRCDPRGRDPWTVARNRHRSGVTCGRPPAFMPMRATDLRPFPSIVCLRRG
jgi:hypothetical protein